MPTQNITGAPFILLSGGIDSTALLSQLVFKENARPRGIFMDVGQRSATRQLATVRKISLRYNVSVDTPTINLRNLFLPLIPPLWPLLAERLLKPDEPVPSATLLVISSYYAALCGAKILY